MRPKCPSGNRRAQPTTLPSASVTRKCSAALSCSSHSMSSGTFCSSINTRRRIAESAFRSRAQSAVRTLNARCRNRPQLISNMPANTNKPKITMAVRGDIPASIAAKYNPAINNMARFSKKFCTASARPAPMLSWPRSCNNAFSGIAKKPPAAPIPSNTAPAAAKPCIGANTQSNGPIAKPPISARFTCDILTVNAARPAPTTMPIDTIPIRVAGDWLSTSPSAMGTHANKSKRKDAPMPQNKLVPSMLKRASGLCSKVLVSCRNWRGSLAKSPRANGLIAASLGINKLTAAAVR